MVLQGLPHAHVNGVITSASLKRRQLSVLPPVDSTGIRGCCSSDHVMQTPRSSSSSSRNQSMARRLHELHYQSTRLGHQSKISLVLTQSTKCLSSTPLCHGAPQSWLTTPHTQEISALSQSSVSKNVPLTTASSPSLAIDTHSTILWMVASVSRYVL